MLLLVVAGVFFCFGWYLSEFVRTYLVENVQSLFQRFFGRQKESRLLRMKQECFCKKENCQRYLYHDFKFHEPQLIPKRASDALENFFDCIFDRFIHSWYKDISVDKEFIDDIKLNLHFACDNLLYRLKEANLSHIICRRIIPTVARHLHTCLAANEAISVQHLSGRDDRLLDKLSAHLHVAMTSRAAEQRYLRGLSRAILPHLLHNTVHVHTRASYLFLEELLSVAVLLPALDVLASPDIVNKILLLLLSNDPAPMPTQPPSPMVRVLHNYHAAFCSHHQGSLIPVKNVHKLNSDPLLLHQFMEYMKSLHLLDLLILFRQLEEINSKVLQPDIPMAVKDSIHRELQLLVESLAHNPALPLLHIPEEFITDVQNLADGPPESVDRIQKCDNWFKAHDALYTFLDSVVMRQFFNSSFYLDMVYRSGRGPSVQKSNSNSKRKEFSLTKLTHKVKDIFKMQSEPIPVRRRLVAEGEFPPGPPAIQQAEDASILLSSHPELGPYVADDVGRVDCAEEAESEMSDWQERDLSSWEVAMSTISQGYRHSLVRAGSDQEDVPRKGSPFASSGTSQLAFVIEVRERGPADQTHWRIHRRYQEFYVLHEKLSEFHGSQLQEVHLPSKRNFGVNKVDFLERVKPDLQTYLQRLLGMTFLHKSELLYRFLRNNDLEFNSSINLGKFMKSVNMKLSKTRGQHLNGFLQSLVTSIEPAKATPRQGGSAEPSPNSSLSATRLHNFVYWNNAAGALGLRRSAIRKGLTKPGCDQSVPDVRTVYDVLDWVLKWADSPHPYALSLTSVPSPVPPSAPSNSSSPPSSSSPAPSSAPARTASRFPVGITWVRAILWGLRPVLRPFLHSGLERLISQALTDVLQEHRVVPVVHLLRDILFSDDGHQRSNRDKQQRREATYTALMELLQHAPLHFLLEKEQLDQRLQTAFSLLQLPKLNKQLTYLLLDDVLHDLFPEVCFQEVAAEAVDALSENVSFQPAS